MTGEQRLSVALDLHELSCDIACEGIRHQNSKVDALKSTVCADATRNSPAPHE
jgi:hypothetical protein